MTYTESIDRALARCLEVAEESGVDVVERLVGVTQPAVMLIAVADLLGLEDPELVMYRPDQIDAILDGSYVEIETTP